MSEGPGPDVIEGIFLDQSHEFWGIPKPEGIDDDDRYEGLLLMEPRSEYDRCIVGIVERFKDRFVLYDRDCVLDAVRAGMGGDDRDDEQSDLDALEHFEFNILGGWHGEATPGFLEGERWQ